MQQAVGTQKALRYVKVGLIADVQYGRNLSNTKGFAHDRYYADAPRKVSSAMKDWSENLTPKTQGGCGNFTGVAFDLGDIVDRRAEDESVASLAEILNLFNPSPRAAKKSDKENAQNSQEGEPQKNEDEDRNAAHPTTVYHVPGNHDLKGCGWNALHAALAPLLPSEPDENTGNSTNIMQDPFALYFSVEQEGVIFVMLDSYELAYLGAPEKVDFAVKFHNELKSRPGDKDQRKHLDHHGELNGAVSNAQLEWFAGVLSDAKEKKKPVIVMSHAPFSTQLSKSNDAACWNGDEVRGIMNSCGGRSTVAACLTGHAHLGSQWRDPESGIPHVVLEASLIGSPQQAGHAILTLGIDDVTGEAREIMIDGRGGIVSNCTLAQRESPM